MTDGTGQPEFSREPEETEEERAIGRVTQLQRLADEVRYAKTRIDYAYTVLQGEPKGRKDDQRLSEFLEVMDSSLSAIQRRVDILITREAPELLARQGRADPSDP